MVCLFALHVRGNLAKLLALTPSSLQTVKILLNRFVADQERQWLDFILQELVQGICWDDALLRMDALTTLIAQTLANPLLTPGYVSDLLDMTLGTSERARIVLQEKVLMYHTPDVEVPAPLYYEQSHLRPMALEEFLIGQLPPPPPPPAPPPAKELPTHAAGDSLRYAPSTQPSNSQARPDLGPHEQGGRGQYEQLNHASGYQQAVPLSADPYAGVGGARGLSQVRGVSDMPLYAEAERDYSGRAADAISQGRGASDMPPYADANRGYSGRAVDAASRGRSQFDADERGVPSPHLQNWPAATGAQTEYEPRGGVSAMMQGLSICQDGTEHVHGMSSGSFGHGRSIPSANPTGRPGSHAAHSFEGQAGWQSPGGSSLRQRTLVDTPSRGQWQPDARDPSIQNLPSGSFPPAVQRSGSSGTEPYRSVSGVESAAYGSGGAMYSSCHSSSISHRPPSAVSQGGAGGHALAPQFSSGYGGMGTEGPRARIADEPWRCKVCTYKHEGAEVMFLSCAVCGSDRS
jgi:hypothetical protein